MPQLIDKQVATLRSDRRYLSFPAVVRLDNGDLLMAYRSGRNCHIDFPEALNLGCHHPHSDVRAETWVARSSDGGMTWLDMPTPRSREALDDDHARGIGYQDVGLTKLPDGRVMLSIFRWKYADELPPADLASSARQEAAADCIVEGGDYDYSRYQPYQYAYMLPPVYTIADPEGRRWTPFKPIDVREPGTGRRWGLASRNGGVLLDRATVGWPYYCCEFDVGTPVVDGCHMLRYHIDRDEWSYGSQMAANDGGLLLEEQLIHRAPDGNLLGFYRSTDQGYMFFNRSTDNGRTWSALRRSAVWGYPFSALNVGDDILLAYGYRRDPMGIRMAWLPGADPEAFSVEREIVVRDDALDDDSGYPSMCFVDDHTIALAYYFFGKYDTMKPTRYIVVERIEIDSIR